MMRQWDPSTITTKLKSEKSEQREGQEKERNQVFDGIPVLCQTSPSNCLTLDLFEYESINPSCGLVYFELDFLLLLATECIFSIYHSTQTTQWSQLLLTYNISNMYQVPPMCQALS